MKKETAIEARRLLADIEDISSLIDKFNDIDYIAMQGRISNVTHDEWNRLFGVDDPEFTVILEGLKRLRSSYERKLEEL